MKCIARSPAANCTNLPIVWEAKVELLSLFASNATGIDASVHRNKAWHNAWGVGKVKDISGMDVYRAIFADKF